MFKPFTALAALESGVLKVNQTIHDDGKYELGPQKYQNAKGAVYGLAGELTDPTAEKIAATTSRTATTP